MWVLNSAALAAISAEAADQPGIERDANGAPTGRLLRLDQWLRDRLPAATHNDSATGLAAYAAKCASQGITGFTDATPDRDQDDIDSFCALAQSGALRQRMVLMAPHGRRIPEWCGRVELGPCKVILGDTMLPSVIELAGLIADAHERGSAVAVHCVTAVQLVLCTAAFEEAGPVAELADRIEHAGVDHGRGSAVHCDGSSHSPSWFPWVADSRMTSTTVSRSLLTNRADIRPSLRPRL